MGSLKDLFNRPTDGQNQPNLPNKTLGGSNTLRSNYRVNKVKLDVKKAAQEINKMEGRRDQLLDDRQKNIDKKEAAQEKLAKYDKVLLLLQKTSDYARQQIKSKIEEIVTQALNVIYGGNHKFKIMLDTNGNRPVAEYWLDDGSGFKKLDRRDDYGQGGGKVDVVGMALQLAVFKLDPEAKGPIFLDEVTKFVDDTAVTNVAYFLKEFKKKFDQQIILITHKEEVAEIGEIRIDVQKRQGESEVVINA